MGGGKEFYCDPEIYGRVAMRLYHNLGKGRFEDVTDKSGISAAFGKGMGISIADFNGDGLMDIFIANDTERNFLFVNQGDGTFREMGYFSVLPTMTAVQPSREWGAMRRTLITTA